jgi:hypothetical protein
MRKGLARLIALGAVVIALAGAFVWRLFALLLPGRAEKPDQALTPQRAEIGKSAVAPSYQRAGRMPVRLSTAPRCFARSPSGALWVAGGSELVEMSAGGAEVARIRLEADATAIAFEATGNMFLAMGNRLEIRGPSGAFIRSFADLDERALIVSIAADPRSSDLFLADAGNRIIHHYTKEGRLLGRIGEKDEAAGIPGFVVPSPYFSIAVSADRRLFAANPGRHGIEIYGYDGRLLGSFYRPSSGIDGFAGCCNPACIFLVDGGILTVEKGVTRVKIVSPTGELLRVVADGESLDPSFLGNPAIREPGGRVLVLDRVAGEISVFEAKEWIGASS